MAQLVENLYCENKGGLPWVYAKEPWHAEVTLVSLPLRIVKQLGEACNQWKL